MKVTKYFFPALILLTACYEPPVATSDSLLINPNKKEMEGDGVDAVTLTLNLDAVDRNARQITLSTNLGFFGDNKEAKTTTVSTDPSGTAMAYLKSETSGDATVQASIGTSVFTYQPIKINPKVVALKVVPQQLQLEANGTAVSRIDVTITKATVKAARTISLTTTLGTFTNGQQTISLTTNDAGVTQANLKSDHGGVALLSATLGSDAAAGAQVTFTASTVAVELTVCNAAVSADGTTTCSVNVIVKNAPTTVPRTISLTSTVGTFTNGQTTQSVTTNPAGEAFTFIKSDVIGTAVVGASLGTDIVQLKQISFSKANPTALIVNTDILEGTSGASNLLTVKVQMIRDVGKPSPGFIPTVEAKDVNGATIGVFTGATASNGDGVSELRFAISDKNFTGPVTFRAKLQLTAMDALESITYGPIIYKAGI